ncbi:unnamed protein product [Heligmosomoides polygyrus]|uniref:HABP4_PAI-RBP1 domain-containing protein n=1 Tax=Heligmosomoides polygyrus TaxID=6339 RepID=A0A183FPR8_HELPZ|nr:unnamed protein product [Heligmosomoides polygyrus]
MACLEKENRENDVSILRKMTWGQVDVAIEEIRVEVVDDLLHVLLEAVTVLSESGRLGLEDGGGGGGGGGNLKIRAPEMKGKKVATFDPNYQTLAGLNNDDVFKPKGGGGGFKGGGGGGDVKIRPPSEDKFKKAATFDPNYQTLANLNNDDIFKPKLLLLKERFLIVFQNAVLKYYFSSMSSSWCRSRAGCPQFL